MRAPADLQLRQFNTEELSWITPPFLKQLVLNEDEQEEEMKMAWMFIKLIFFNKSHPENMTVRLKCKKEHTYVVHMEDTWVPKTEDDLIHDLIESVCETLVCVVSTAVDNDELVVGRGLDVDFDSVFVKLMHNIFEPYGVFDNDACYMSMKDCGNEFFPARRFKTKRQKEVAYNKMVRLVRKGLRTVCV